MPRTGNTLVMLQPPTIDPVFEGDPDGFDVTEFYEELRMVVSFAILDLDVAGADTPAAA